MHFFVSNFVNITHEKFIYLQQMSLVHPDHAYILYFQEIINILASDCTFFHKNYVFNELANLFYANIS